MRYALIEDGVVTNLIFGYISIDNMLCVLCEHLPVSIGDTYDGKHFYHENKRVYSQTENEILDLQEMAVNSLFEIELLKVGGLLI